MNEVIIASAETTGLYNPQTGSSIASFKIPPSKPHATAVVETKHGQGGLILSAADDKPLLYAYSFQKDQPLHKMVLPEKISCLDIDINGVWCAAGTPSGRVYLWEIASGALFKSFSAHYRSVAVLKFFRDSTAFITGSEDSGISVWSVPRLVDYEQENQAPIPILTLGDHTLPITDIYVGVGIFSSARILSSSLDNSVKLWCTNVHTSETGPTTTLLATFNFPSAVHALTCDPAERFFFAASNLSTGDIYQTRLFKSHPEKSYMEALGSGMLGERYSALDPNNRLITVGSKVSCLALTTTTQLLVGTESGEIKIYDTLSLQPLRSISLSTSAQAYPITFLITISKPADLLGHTRLQMSTSSKDEIVPIRPILAFARTKEVTKGKLREVSMLLSGRQPESNVKYDPIGEDFAYFTQQKAGETNEVTVAALQNEVIQLREQLNKAKSINDAMWESVVQRENIPGRGS